MKLKKMFKNAGLEKIKLGPKWASAEISFQASDRAAVCWVSCFPIIPILAKKSMSLV